MDITCRDKKVSYRMAKPEDLVEIGQLIQAAVCRMEENNIYQWDEIYPTNEDFAEDLQQKNLYVGICEDRIAVVFVLNQLFDEEYKNGTWRYPEKSFYILHRLCVHPDFQNKGVAKETMVYIEAFLREKKVEAIRLDAYSQNPFALRLYEKAGYHKVGHADWRKGRFFLMEKYL